MTTAFGLGLGLPLGGSGGGSLPTTGPSLDLMFVPATDAGEESLSLDFTTQTYSSGDQYAVWEP